MKSRKKFNPILKWLFKVPISAIALYMVFLKIEIDQIISLANDLRLFFIFIALIFFNLSQVVSAFRYRNYLKIFDIRLTPWRTIKLYYLGMFYNLFLPGGIGGDGYKAWLLKRAFSSSWKLLITASFLERLNGLVALVALALIILFFIPVGMLFPIPAYFYLLAAGLTFPVLYVVIRMIDEKYSGYFTVISLQSLLIQISQVICAYFTLVSLGLKDDFTVYLFLFLVSGIAAVLPVTVSGIGARELVFIYGFSLFPIDTSLAVTFSLLFFLITALSSLAGVFFDFSSPASGFKYRTAGS